MQLSILLKYPILNLVSIGKKNFENLGRIVQRCGNTISRMLRSAPESIGYTQYLCQSMFRNKKKLFCIIDDTLIKKIHSQWMQGAGKFYDGKVGKRIMAYRLVLCLVSDGKFAIPIEFAYLFSKELTDLIPDKFQTKDEIAKIFIEAAIRLFGKEKIIVAADGLYTTINLLKWCIKHEIAAEMRMHSNRVVIFNGERLSLKKLSIKKGIRPVGRQMARTISVEWHDMKLEITIVRRIDRHGDETIVFQVATYKALPREHVKAYKARWSIEKMIRTSKQHLGLQDCFSRKLEIQRNHVASVLLSYALVQLEMKRCRCKTPEQAIRRCKTKNAKSLTRLFVDQLGACSGFM